MIRKLPFVGRIFWKVLVVIAVLVVVAWLLITRFAGYEMKPADYGGSTICTVLFAYLVHLWLLPVEDEGSEENPPPDEQSSSTEDSRPDA